MNRQTHVSIITKTAVFAIAVFFVFYGVSEAVVSSSKSYKLHAAFTDDGGVEASSPSYNSASSIGSPVVTAEVSGTNYKSYGGGLVTMNSIPETAIVSYNDGTLILDETPTLQWSYEDKDEDLQYSYQVQLSKNNFVDVTVDSGLVLSSDTSFTSPILPTDEAGIGYRWRVRVSDGFDYSGWQVATNGFRLTTEEMEVPIIWAKVSSVGDDVPSGLWQYCGDPYMYWEYPVTGIDIVGYSYAWGAVPNDEVDTIGVSYQTPSDLLSDGTRVFNLKGQNTASTWSEMVSFEIWIDRGAPSVGSYSPTDGTIIATDVPTVSIDATDEFSGINPNGITMKVNKTTVNATYDEGIENIVYIPFTPLSEGDNVISLEVSDMVGNKTSPLIWSFVVDTKAPTGSIIINNQDAVTNSIYVDLRLSASDSTTEVKGMVISNDGVFDTEGWENFSLRKENWQLPTISGTRKVYVKFKDTTGNESEILSDTIELIIIAPDTIITSGPSMQTTSKYALFTFKSTVDGCVFRWKFDAEEWSDFSTDASTTKKELSDGNHYFKVQAAKDVNNNGEINADEIDPVPEERTWTIGEIARPQMPKKRPFRFWKKE